MPPVLDPALTSQITPELVEGALLSRSLRSFIASAWSVIESMPFVPNWHIDAITDHLEAVSRRQIRKLAILIPPGTSKALDHDTPVLTTWGWKRHGDLEPGDFVFSPDGRPVRVLGVTPEFIEESYEVEFNKDTKVVAGAGHLWAVEVDHCATAPKWRRSRVARIVRTRELAVAEGERGARIRLAAPISHPPKSLLIDPYILGAWVGDGLTAGGTLCVGAQDIEHFRQYGHPRLVRPANRVGKTKDYWMVLVPELQTKLRLLGLLGREKHIPAVYLEGSVEQRIALLQGLMDTDGCGTRAGDCTFSTKYKQLALQVCELACSLGLKAKIGREKYTTLNGKRHGPYYLVQFFPTQPFAVFRLQRKQARIEKSLLSQNARPRHHYVTGVKPVGLRRVKCIQVEGDLYLVGRSFITTHNSTCVSVMWPVWDWTSNPTSRWLFQSHSQELVLDHALRARNILRSDWYAKRWPLLKIKEDQDQKGRYDTSSGGYRVSTVIGGHALGLHPTHIVWDDPNKRDTVSSALERKFVNDAWDQTISTRGVAVGVCHVIVMQRLHEDDAVGHILGREDGWVQLVLPMRYEPRRMVTTPLGWNDPRTEPLQLLDPVRFPEPTVSALERILGSYGCTPAGSPVLMADLSQKPIEAVKPGELVVGFTRADPKRRRVLKPAVVKAIHSYVGYVHTLVLSNGDLVRCTPDHRWYKGKSGTGRSEYSPAKVGSRLCLVADTKVPLVTSLAAARTAGWLAGFFDGEGSASGKKGVTPRFYQGAGRNLPLCEKLERGLAYFGFRWRVDRRTNHVGTPLRAYVLLGGLPAVQRFLSVVQPVKWRERLVSGVFVAGARFVLDKPHVVEVRPGGVEPVFALETETGNYIVQGYASSNSAGQLQQRPAPLGGGLIQRKHLRFWVPLGQDLGPVIDPETGQACMVVERPAVFDQEIQSWDMSFKDELLQVRKGHPPDPVSGLVLARHRASIYLLDRINKRMDVLASAQAVLAMTRRWPDARVKLIEDKANGPAVRAILRAHGVISQPVTPEGSKLHRVAEAGSEQKSKDARAMSMQAMIEAGEFYLPHPKLAYWVWAYVAELCGFPTFPTDDDVDATSQAFLYFQRFIDTALLAASDAILSQPFPSTTEEIVRRALWKQVGEENEDALAEQGEQQYLDSPVAPWLN